MFSFLDSKSSAAKANVSQGTLPPFVDPEQPPSKKNPFSTILGQPFTHTVQLILPQELYDALWDDIEAKIGNIQYSRVIMSLSQILEGEFFNKYIKIGNVLMLSEGRPGVDDRYSLKDGILRLELAKDKYERCGLVGEPIRDAGRKHIKTRFAVELNLRSPSVLHGKKGFERIVWAFKNVLHHSVTWLFHDFDSTSDHGKAIAMIKSLDNKVIESNIAAEETPITKHHPMTKICSPQKKTVGKVRVPNIGPSLFSDSDEDFDDRALETYEWLSLVALESPRILSEDTIDPFLSRYQTPHHDSGKALNIALLTWTGFIPTVWIMHLFINLSMGKTANRKGVSSDDFFALSAYSFKTAVTDQKDAYTILCLSDGIVNSQNTVESGHSKVEHRHDKGYLLWELSL